MHELSIAQNIVEIVQQHLPQNGSHSVQTVRVRAGALAGVVPESLEFAFEVIVADTPLRGAVLEIEHVPCSLECNDCHAVSQAEPAITLCPNCGGVNTRVIGGTELVVTEIEVVEKEEVP